jgi:hypothetical protein
MIGEAIGFQYAQCTFLRLDTSTGSDNVHEMKRGSAAIAPPGEQL